LQDKVLKAIRRRPSSNNCCRGVYKSCDTTGKYDRILNIVTLWEMNLTVTVPKNIPTSSSFFFILFAV